MGSRSDEDGLLVGCFMGLCAVRVIHFAAFIEWLYINKLKMKISDHNGIFSTAHVVSYHFHTIPLVMGLKLYGGTRLRCSEAERKSSNHWWMLLFGKS